MLQRIVNEPIMLVRDGKIVYPEVGSVVELSQEELSGLNKANPNALRFPLTDEQPLVAAPKKPSVK